MNAFVGVKQVSSADELKKLLEQPAKNPNYYFLRWPHKVSGIVENLKDFPTPEGQMFNCDRELRWKQQGQGYTVLLLSTIGQDSAFTPIDEKRAWKIEWKVEQRPAYGYRSDETRFPQLLIISDSLDIRINEEKVNAKKPKLAQRYFIDKKTATVHFVGLTIEIPQ